MINGWRIFYFKLFQMRLNQLEQKVRKLQEKSPDTYQQHPTTKLLASVLKVITQQVPADPDHADFRLGKTLGDQYTAFRRVKKGMPDRYRLFFRFTSETVSIIYIWLNDQNSLRKEGSKTDVYVVFKKLLDKGTVPMDIGELIKRSSELKDQTPAM